MNEASRLSLRKSLRKLREAEIVNVHDAPGAVIHSAYYSMLHAAKAFVLDRSVMEPRKHGAIIGEFGRLLKDESADAREYGRAINRAHAMRNADDYDVMEVPDASDAGEVRTEARVLFLYVAQQLGVAESELDGADDDASDLENDSSYRG